MIYQARFRNPVARIDSPSDSWPLMWEPVVT